MQKQKEENNQLQQAVQKAEQLEQQLKEVSQQAEKLQQQVQQLNQEKLQIEKREIELKNKVEVYKAQTDRNYKEVMAEEAKKRTQAELAQLTDGNPYNDEIRNI